MADPPWLASRTGGVELVVHARPGARRSELAGLHGAALAVRLAARPVEGAANQELIRLLAEALAVPLRAISLLGGERSRTKRVHVTGITVDTARARLAPYL